MSANSIGRREFNKILKKYSEGKCTPAEKDLVKKWYDAIGEDIQFSLNEDREHELERTLWNRLSFRMHADPTGNNLNNLRYHGWKVTRIAAAILIAITAITYVVLINKSSDTRHTLATATTNETTISNSESITKVVHLEDGSTITLQPKSTITFASHFQKQKREVKLSGEAFFDVAHDKQRPFIVYTKNVITRVLGTSFNIHANDNDPSVIVCVKTGRVSVSRESTEFFGIRKTIREEAILIPNQKAIFDLEDDKVQTTLIEDPQPLVATQKMKLMKFDEEPVPSILQALEKMYGVEIQFDKTLLKSCSLTTVLSEEGLYERLNIICKAIDGTYETQGTRIILKSRGCKN